MFLISWTTSTDFSYKQGASQEEYVESAFV